MSIAKKRIKQFFDFIFNLQKLSAKSILVSFFFAVIIMLVFKHFELTDEERMTNLAEFFRQKEFNDVITRKYIDRSNHSYKTLELKNIQTAEISRAFLNGDDSGFFGIVKEGDTLKKKIGNLEVNILNDDRDTTITLTFF